MSTPLTAGICDHCGSVYVGQPLCGPRPRSQYDAASDTPTDNDQAAIDLDAGEAT